MSSPDGAERAQKLHYQKIGAAYRQHYFDAWSWRYRREFIHADLLAGEDWRGKKVLEAMCGTGSVAGDLQALGAEVYGLDLSLSAIAAYREEWRRPALVASLLQPGLKAGTFDAIIIVGGLHHLHPHLSAGLDALAALLKDEGSLRFFEPHATAWPDKLRGWWYRHDPLFGSGEASIHPRRLLKEHGRDYEEIASTFGGGPAYLFVFNSLIWRLPIRLKSRLAPGLFWLEKILSPLQSERFSFFVIGRWRKRPRLHGRANDPTKTSRP